MNELKPCPLCGGEVELVGGPEEWKPSFYDPDSGGDPYFVICECGLSFSKGSYDAVETTSAWNRRATDE